MVDMRTRIEGPRLKVWHLASSKLVNASILSFHVQHHSSCSSIDCSYFIHRKQREVGKEQKERRANRTDQNIQQFGRASGVRLTSRLLNRLTTFRLFVCVSKSTGRQV